jgi:hypothetical protein
MATVVLFLLLLIFNTTNVSALEEDNGDEETTFDWEAYTWDDVSALGIPYPIELEAGETHEFTFKLQRNRHYTFWLYGQFLETGTDYDLALYDTSDSLIERATASAGHTEIIEYEATETGYYKVLVENDPRQSDDECPGKLVVLETIALDEIRSVKIDGAINKTGGWEPRLNTYYGFLLDARPLKNATLEVKLTTPDDVDMYEMRLYKRPVKEEKIDKKYDALAAYSEVALLTDDAPTMGDDLYFNFTIATESFYEMREKGIFYDEFFIVELIGERGDGTCEFIIQEAPEPEADTSEQGEDDNNNQDDIASETDVNKPLTFRQIVGGFLVLGVFCVTIVGFVWILKPK